MKKILIITTLLLLLPVWARSQDGLHSQAVFDGKIIPKDRLIETLVTGDHLKEYNLDLFHSVRLEVDEAEYQSIAALVQEDAKNAISKEMDIVHGHLSYALLVFPSKDPDKRFLGFNAGYKSGQDNEADRTVSVTIVYLEGNTTVTDLKKNFSVK